MDEAPLADGLTSFTGYSSLNCQPNSVQNLENELNSTMMPAFGSRMKSNDKRSNDRGSNDRKSKKIEKSKKLKLKSKLKKYKKQSKKLKKRLRSFTRKSKFGIPNAPFYPPVVSLGLPPDVTSSPYLSYANPFLKGAPLPQPYGPIDQQRMPLLFNVAGFGSKRRLSQRLNKLTNRKFGSTPGTNEWASEASKPEFYENQAQPLLKGAVGNVSPTINYYNGVNTIEPKPLSEQYIKNNVPMQYTDNQLNNPIPGSTGFGKSTNRKITNKLVSQATNHLANKSESKSIKSGFGAMSTTSSIQGPNVVGYETPMPIYHGGAMTMDFATNKVFNSDIVGGPTNSVGPYASAGTFSTPVMKVLPDGITPNAGLATAAGLDASSSNGANKLINNGLGFGKSRINGVNRVGKNGINKINKNENDQKKKFGTAAIYNPSSLIRGAGNLTITQPLPSYLDKSRTHVNGDYVGFGKSASPAKKIEKKELKTSFGGKLITLNSNGNITISD